jgi:hypothetical protein
MQRSVETSEMLKYRSETIVPTRLARIEKAIWKKDFETFGLLTMQVYTNKTVVYVRCTHMNVGEQPVSCSLPGYLSSHYVHVCNIKTNS